MRGKIFVPHLLYHWIKPSVFTYVSAKVRRLLFIIEWRIALVIGVVMTVFVAVIAISVIVFAKECFGKDEKNEYDTNNNFHRA